MNRGVMFQYFEWNCPADGSLWRQLAERARELRNLGCTAVWMPPAYKAMDGDHDTGYAVYDLYDLGEFDQKGSVRTKYGTRDEFIAAVKAVRDAGMNVYADVVLNHRMGADEMEEVEVEEVHFDNRLEVIAPAHRQQVWSKFTFPGRGDRHSPFKLHAGHFTAFGHSTEGRRILRHVGKQFATDVCDEFGNFDYLMGADVDLAHPEVRDDLFRWGEWFVRTAGLDGFRLDALKHIPAAFYKDWLEHVRRVTGQEMFAVGEYWSPNVDDLRCYLEKVGGSMRLFDAPLHFRFFEAAKQGADCNLQAIFDGTFVQLDPVMAVTIVDNHDTQPGQALTSWVGGWFKPLAYALILLREQGYPCVFYGDYFGSPGDAEGNHKLTSHRKLIDDFLQARAKFTFGQQIDYFDHPACVGWCWTGDAEHPVSLAVIMSSDEAMTTKRMKPGRPHTTFRDITGHWGEPVTTDEQGEAEFVCAPGKVSVWCSC